MEQGTLRFQKSSEDVSDQVLNRCKDLRAAVRLCIETSGRQIKEIAFDLDLNKDHLSRMINTSDDPRHFPVERLNDLMTVCGNEIPLRWQALSRGYGLYRLKTELELEVERLHAKLDEQNRERETMLKVFREMKG
jgi:hypothetical protein